MESNNTDSDVEYFLANREELEGALSVLIGSDGNNCSYSRGYVKRQAVFACNTCTPNAEEPAGVCLACANNCHDGHDVFELYTKRNFRCDCGNGKFGEFQCQLIPSKDEENVKNLYNHNFNGCYCTCDRPYPDTDDQVNDEMIQCVICEDWFHSRHLGCTLTEPEELEEMVCEACMNKAPFLWTYAAHFAVVNTSQPEEQGEVDVEDSKDKEETSGPSHRNGNEEPSTSTEQKKQEEAVNRSSPCKRTHEEMTGDLVKPNKVSVECRLKELQVQGLERPKEGAVFWPYSWRSKLCTCISCKRAYVAAQVPFLMDQSDTILAYEKRGFDEPFGLHPLMALTDSMSCTQQLEVIYGEHEEGAGENAVFNWFFFYDNMQVKLTEMLCGLTVFSH
uniref:Putative E3 ubiquitin-protein ligase UBR7 n=1 Tax=Sphaeramia orbicularis TaxID=375764 RepID=A0A673C971_9TELE